MIAAGEPKAVVARTLRIGRTTLYRHRVPCLSTLSLPSGWKLIKTGRGDMPRR